MNMPGEMHTSAHKEDVQLTEKESSQLAIGLSAILCGIFLAFSFSMYLFGLESTIDATVGALALGAVFYLGAVVCFKTFLAQR